MEIIKIIWILFIMAVLHLAAKLLNRQVDTLKGFEFYLALIVITGFNVLKILLLFVVIFSVINRF